MRIHSAKRLPREEPRSNGMIESIRGKSCKHCLVRYGFKIPTHVGEEQSSENQDQATVAIYVGDGDPGFNVPAVFEAQSRPFSALRGDMVRYGASSKCPACKVIWRCWKSTFAPSAWCRDRVRTKLFVNGGQYGRVENATPKCIAGGPELAIE